jgi:hypothetical protein
VLHHHPIFESFGNVYGVSVILAMPLKMYVQHFLVADYLICVIPGICAAPGDLDLDPFNVFEYIFRERRPSGDQPIETGLRDD